LAQIFYPSYTAQLIFNLSGKEFYIFIRELGMANLSIGIAAMLSIKVTVKAQDLEDKQPPSRSGQDFLNPSVAGQATAGFAVGHLPIFISALTQRGAFFFAESAS
jgi:hypothetical protein